MFVDVLRDFSHVYLWCILKMMVTVELVKCMVRSPLVGVASTTKGCGNHVCDFSNRFTLPSPNGL